MVEGHQEHPDESLLHAYLDETLDPRAHGALVAHLTLCPECAETVAELLNLYSALESLPEEPLSRDLAPAVMRAIQPGYLAASRMRTLLTTQLVLALAMLALLGRGWRIGLAPLDLVEVGRRVEGLIHSAAYGLLNRVLEGTLTTWQWIGRQLKLDLASIPSALPAVEVWGVTAFAVVLWLFGNGFILRQMRQRLKNRAARPGERNQGNL